jgi:hypothetical protein
MAALGSMHLRRTRVEGFAQAQARHRQSVHVKTIGPAADEPAWMPCARRCSSAGGVALTAAQVAGDDAAPSFLRLVVSYQRRSQRASCSRRGQSGLSNMYGELLHTRLPPPTAKHVFNASASSSVEDQIRDVDREGRGSGYNRRWR